MVVNSYKCLCVVVDEVAAENIIDDIVQDERDEIVCRTSQKSKIELKMF